jgi:hypothetical protein
MTKSADQINYLTLNNIRCHLVTRGNPESKRMHTASTLLDTTGSGRR